MVESVGTVKAMKYITTVADKEYIIEVDGENGRVLVNDEPHDLDFQQLGNGGLVSMLLNNRSFEGAVDRDEEGWHVLLRGDLYDVTVQDERAYRLAKARGELADDTGEVQIKAPMPGVVVKIPVAVGEAVAKGQTVIILESMKMENELKATRDAVVLEVLVVGGTAVEKNQPLVRIGDAPED